MTIIDKRQPKPRKQVHRATFTDGEAPAPAVVAVDAQPRAGDPTWKRTLGSVTDESTFKPGRPR